MNELAETLYDAWLDEGDMQRVWFSELSESEQQAWRRVTLVVENREMWRV